MTQTKASSLSVNQPVISVEAAHKALAATVAHAEQLGITINVAITDSAGVLAGFLRMPTLESQS